MAFLLIGVNHQTAPLTIRERLAFSAEMANQALKAIEKTLSITEAVILSTCNRIEIYANVDQIEALIHWLEQYQQFSPGELRPYIYFHHEQAAMRHAAKVACGLDSLALGEPQIFGQLKEAFELAVHQNMIKREFHQRFQTIFHLGKKIRTQTDISKNPLSIAFAAVTLAKKIFADLSKCRVLLVGAGQTIHLVTKYFAEQQVKEWLFVNRSLDKAVNLANTFGGEAFELNELALVLGQADIIVTATNSQQILINKDMLQQAFQQQQKRRPLLLLDLAVPRNIDNHIGDMRDRYLYTVDDLQQVITETLKSRKQAAQQAEMLIEQAIREFYQKLKLTPQIRAWREEAERLRDQLLNTALEKLQEGQSAEEAIKQLAQKLTQQLLHQPSRWWQSIYEQEDEKE